MVDHTRIPLVIQRCKLCVIVFHQRPIWKISLRADGNSQDCWDVRRTISYPQKLVDLWFETQPLRFEASSSYCFVPVLFGNVTCLRTLRQTENGGKNWARTNQAEFWRLCRALRFSHENKIASKNETTCVWPVVRKSVVIPVACAIKRPVSPNDFLDCNPQMASFLSNPATG